MKTFKINKNKIYCPAIKDEDLLPSGCLYIKGWITNDYDGIISVREEENNYSWYRPISIVSQIEDYAESHGFLREKTKGLGGRQSFIRGCNMRAYFSKSKCALAEAQRRFDALLYGGDIITETSYTGYSEWTITGMDLDEFTIGGHDLDSELYSHLGEYVHIIIECDK